MSKFITISFDELREMFHTHNDLNGRKFISIHKSWGVENNDIHMIFEDIEGHVYDAFGWFDEEGVDFTNHHNNGFVDVYEVNEDTRYYKDYNILMECILQEDKSVW